MAHQNDTILLEEKSSQESSEKTIVHFINLDTNPIKNSFGLDENPFKRIVETAADRISPFGYREHITRITHQGRSFRAKLTYLKGAWETTDSFTFIVPEKVSTGLILSIRFDVPREGETETQIIAHIEYLDVSDGRLAQLDRFDTSSGTSSGTSSNSRSKGRKWAKMSHAGTYFMKMTEQLFRCFRVSKAVLNDVSSLILSKNCSVPYTPLRFFLGKKSWYENFGYSLSEDPKRDEAQEQLKILCVSESI